ncbi:MAG: transcriptional repressor [Roseburia sp.]
MPQHLTKDSKQSTHSADVYRVEMQKEMMLQKLRERGCRITKQREILLDVILQEDCASCKEIYYKASAIDSAIGAATVYRMVNLLEEIGAISRKNMYKISCGMSCEKGNVWIIELDNHTICRLSAQNWYQVLSEGLRACGYIENQKVIRVTVAPCRSECN